jgi:hypothetical protein
MFIPQSTAFSLTEVSFTYATTFLLFSGAGRQESCEEHGYRERQRNVILSLSSVSEGIVQLRSLRLRNR